MLRDASALVTCMQEEAQILQNKAQHPGLTSLDTIWGRLLRALEAKLRDALRRKAEKAEKAGIWWKSLLAHRLQNIPLKL